MPETVRMWVEILFNVAYLLVVWGLVWAMVRHRHTVAPGDRAVALRVRWMFGLLALGDSGHVGFRVLAYALGGLDANPMLVGVGALATALTITFFYMLLVDVWRLRFGQRLSWFSVLLLATGILRLAIMALPGNEWGRVIPPQPMSLYRNLPLMVQGLGAMFLVLRDAFRGQDRPFRWVGTMVFFSYLFYTPVILFSAQAPLLGMLMIPKTLAYLGVAIIAYRALYRPPSPSLAPAAGQG
jgi:hypothetical protein